LAVDLQPLCNEPARECKRKRMLFKDITLNKGMQTPAQVSFRDCAQPRCV